MMDWFKSWSARRKQKGHYQNVLWDLIKDHKFEPSHRAQLEEIGRGLKEKDLRKLKVKVTQRVIRQFMDDQKITTDEHKYLSSVAEFTGVKFLEVGLLNEASFTLMRFRGLISEGKLVPFGNENAPVVMKSGETLTFASPARIMKVKRVTKRVGYSGFSTSVRICKGVHYRVGSYRPITQTSEHLVTDDTGVFWVSDQRIGFKGSKNFAFDIGKVASYEINGDGLLEIFKDGKEKPYLIGTAELDTIAAIISLIVNEEYELLASNQIAV